MPSHLNSKNKKFPVFWFWFITEPPVYTVCIKHFDTTSMTCVSSKVSLLYRWRCVVFLAGKIWIQSLWLVAFSTAGIPSVRVVKDGKPARACFPIKQAALRLAEQITTGESERSRTSIQTNQLQAEFGGFFFSPHFLPVAFALIFYSLFPFPPLKTLAPSCAKTSLFFVVVVIRAFSRPAESIGFLYGGAEGTL